MLEILDALMSVFSLIRNCLNLLGHWRICCSAEMFAMLMGRVTDEVRQEAP